MHDWGDEMYPKTRAAEQRTGPERESFAPYVFVALAIGLLCIVVVALTIVLSDNPARGAADHGAVVVKPTATPGPPVPSPTGCGVTR